MNNAEYAELETGGLSHTRRGLFKGLSVTAMSGLVPIGVPDGRSIILNKVYVAGASQFAVTDLARDHRVRVGTELQLYNEIENSMDSKAVAVRSPHSGTKLGYVPMAESWAIWRLLRQRQPLYATAIEINDRKLSWKRLRIEIGLNGSISLPHLNRLSE